MPRQAVKIRIADSALNRMDEIVQELERTGLEATTELDRLGIVIGTCHASDVPALEAIPGVDSVRPEQEFGIAPPESTVQ